MAEATSTPRRISTYQVVRIVLGIAFSAYIIWRLVVVLIIDQTYGPEIWLRFAITGLIIGSVYAVIAIGYTLVYGILFMINFAHGEVMMLGAFAGYFVFEGLSFWVVDPATGASFLNTYPFLAVLIAFAVGMGISTGSGVLLERIAYRPLRNAPRLVPLISAIGASFFLQNVALLMFSSQRRSVTKPDVLGTGRGFEIMVNESPVIVTYTGLLTFVLSIVLLIGLYILVQRTRLGRSMRAVAEDKQTAALMGIDVDRVIAQTFAISGAMAGAAGVMWAIHNGFVNHFIGFIPGLKAFTAAVLGGIGNVPGAMLGGLILGIVETLGPPLLGIGFQLKDVIAFSILVLILVFRPTGILGEVLSEEKV
jgi:branched-chain amino acid transport system permease protein